MKLIYIILFLALLFLYNVEAISLNANISVQMSSENWEPGTESSYKNKNWLTAEGELYKTYGNSTDKWGLADVTFPESSFQLAFFTSYVLLGLGGTVRVDNVQIRIYYTVPLNITLRDPSPVNNSNASSTMFFNATTNQEVTNCVLRHNMSGVYVDVSMTDESGINCTPITMYGRSNTTFSYKVYATTTDGITGESENRTIFLRNLPSNILLNYPANNSILSASSVLLNWTVNNSQNDFLIMRGFISQNTTANISRKMFYYQTGVPHLNLPSNINGTFTYDLTSMMTPFNASGLWALYRFDNNSDEGENVGYIKDHSGYNRNGTGAIEFRSGKFGRGMFHDTGVEYGVEMTMLEKDFRNITNTSTNGMSINAWINMTNNLSSGTVTQRWNGNPCSPGACFFRLKYEYSTKGKMIWEIYTGSSNIVCSANSTRNIEMNKWYMVTGTFNGSQTAFYQDGTLMQNTTCSFNGVDQSQWQGAPLLDPIVGEHLGGTSAFEGTIDELSFWNKSLNASEVSDLYNLKNDTYFWFIETNEYNSSKSQVNSSLFQFTLGSFGTCATSTCSYQCSDNCFINSDIDCGGSPLLILNDNGAGYVYFNKTVTNYARRIDIENSCELGILTPAGMIN